MHLRIEVSYFMMMVISGHILQNKEVLGCACTPTRCVKLRELDELGLVAFSQIDTRKVILSDCCDKAFQCTVALARVKE